LAQWGSREKDVIALVEHVRGSMARYITNKFSIHGRLRVVMISGELEELLRKGIRQTSGGSFLNLDPQTNEEIVDRFALFFQTGSISQKDVVVLTAVDIRRFVKKLLEPTFPDLDVVSFGEIASNADVSIVKEI